uniref:hypothetical protein n=1 Tax=Prevotella sp. TaxID=59823 RepID=UPI004025A230
NYVVCCCLTSHCRKVILFLLMLCHVLRKKRFDVHLFLIYVIEKATLGDKKGRTPTGALPLPTNIN